MSNISNKTEYRALIIIAKMVKTFEALHYLNMTAQDDWNACRARTLLEGIVQSNEYYINYHRESKKSILKLKK